jgi:hypothetical protein
MSCTFATHVPAFLHLGSAYMRLGREYIYIDRTRATCVCKSAATNNPRRYSSSQHLRKHAPKPINRVKDVSKMCLMSTEHRSAATPAFRAARAPDVASAQGEWGDEPREEGGATEKKEAILHLPDSSPLCFCKRLLLFFFFGWDIGILPPSPSTVPCHSQVAAMSNELTPTTNYINLFDWQRIHASRRACVCV